ncbi:MAG: TolB family protein [Gammaproteobacteria bacterium]
MSMLTRRQPIPVSLSAPPPACARLDRVMALLCTWLVLGLYIDGWAHRHFKIETFLTPWHLILYSGFLAVATYLLFIGYRNHVQGYPWRRAMPPGYELSLLGLLIFVLSGLGDLIWHELFGFEHDLEALFSPTHLVLALGGTLMIAGPFRSAWQRPDTPSAPSLATQWPMLLSLTLLLSILTFFTQFAHPFVEVWLVQDMARWDVPREIFVMKADGSSQIRLARTPAQSLTHPCWSLDGRRIVFAAGTWTYKQNAPSDAEIYVINADGTDPKRLTDNDSYDGHPSWSPDASQIAFESLRDGSDWEIYAIDAEGGLGSNLTDNPAMEDANDARPSWSPDSTRIAFGSTGHPRYSRFLRQALGIASILVQTALQMGLILLAVWRWELRFPSLTLVFTLNAVLNLTQSHEYNFPLLGAAVLAGLAADIFLKLLKPSVSEPRALRLFGFTVPSVFYGSFFTVLMFTGGIGWSAHLWMGSIVLAGVTGWLLTYLLVPGDPTA